MQWKWQTRSLIERDWTEHGVAHITSVPLLSQNLLPITDLAFRIVGLDAEWLDTHAHTVYLWNSSRPCVWPSYSKCWYPQPNMNKTHIQGNSKHSAPFLTHILSLLSAVKISSWIVLCDSPAEKGNFLLLAVSHSEEITSNSEADGSPVVLPGWWSRAGSMVFGPQISTSCEGTVNAGIVGSFNFYLSTRTSICKGDPSTKSMPKSYTGISEVNPSPTVLQMLVAAILIIKGSPYSSREWILQGIFYISSWIQIICCVDEHLL